MGCLTSSLQKKPFFFFYIFGFWDWGLRCNLIYFLQRNSCDRYSLTLALKIDLSFWEWVKLKKKVVYSNAPISYVTIIIIIKNVILLRTISISTSPYLFLPSTLTFPWASMGIATVEKNTNQELPNSLKVLAIQIKLTSTVTIFPISQL